MLSGSGPWLPLISHLDGMSAMVTYSWSVLFLLPSNKQKDGLALIVVLPTIIQIIVLFVSTLHNRYLVDKGVVTEDNLQTTLPQPSPLSNKPLLQSSQTSYHLYRSAMISTSTLATDKDISLPTAASNVVPITPYGVVRNPNPLHKPYSWTPIRSFLLERELSLHPDKAYVKALIDDLQHGCSIGYTGPQFVHLATNLPSEFQQPNVIDAALEKECKARRILGPFQVHPLQNFHTSGLGLVPKHDGSWRVIYHLSAPAGHSINDYIDPLTYSLSYCTIDHAYTIINKLVLVALLSKIDLKDAFCLIPMRPAD